MMINQAGTSVAQPEIEKEQRTVDSTGSGERWKIIAHDDNVTTMEPANTTAQRKQVADREMPCTVDGWDYSSNFESARTGRNSKRLVEFKHIRGNATPHSFDSRF